MAEGVATKSRSRSRTTRTGQGAWRTTRSAVLPSVHPKDEKPSTDMAAAPITAARPMVGERVVIVPTATTWSR